MLLLKPFIHVINAIQFFRCAKTSAIKNGIQFMAVAISLLVLSACSASPTPTKQGHATHSPYLFRTLISKTGIKRFELILTPRPLQVSSSYYSHNQNRKPRGVKEKKLIRVLNNKLKQNKFCRSGYLLLGRYAGKKTNRLRGECKEKASEADKQNFKNTIKAW